MISKTNKQSILAIKSNLLNSDLSSLQYMFGSAITGCRPDFVNITSIICSCNADNPSLLFIPGLLEGQCVSPLFF